MAIHKQLSAIVLAAFLPLPILTLLLLGAELDWFAAASLTGGICAAGAVWLWTRDIGVRLGSLTQEIKNIGEGAFDARVVARRRHSELRSLEESLNHMAEALVERRKQLSELDQVKSDFVSSASHELRTPLATIKALTRLLMRPELAEEKRREYLETISVECDRQIDLVLNLLDLSRIEGGVFRVALERVDVADVISSCVKSETSSAQKRGHTLRSQAFDNIPHVCADPKALRRVVSNLIENAIKYTPDGGLITVSVRNAENAVRIMVADNGRGIPPGDLPVLFDKFHRGRPAAHSAAMRSATENAEFLEDADVSGVGLGLYLARNVMGRMGGEITVDTEVGRGSTFNLHIPIWTPEDCGSVSEKEAANGEKIAGS